MSDIDTRLDRTPRPGAEAGSAYLAVLLALVVLSIVGLALTLVTQNEMVIGSNQRTVTRVLYDADAGINEATARVLALRDHQPKTLLLDDPAAPAGLGLGSRLEISHILPVHDSPCNLCQINQGSDFFKINHALTVHATRVGLLGTANETPLANKTLSVMVDIQPWQLLPEALAFDTTDADGNGMPDVLEKLRF